MTSEEYAKWLEKFDERRTSDDTFTPPAIYDAVLEYVKKRYDIDAGTAIIRPFYPGGDYEREEYPDGCVVVDNPPFSILSKIVKFYISKGIRFFLFAPGNTALGGKSVASICTTIATNADITYDNGAGINTSFKTNMEPGVILRSDPKLYKVLTDLSRSIDNKKRVTKYKYPDELIKVSDVSRMSTHGVEFELREGEGVFVSRLDAMTDGRTIYGGGFLISDEARDRFVEAKKKCDKVYIDKMLTDKSYDIKYELTPAEHTLRPHRP